MIKNIRLYAIAAVVSLLAVTTTAKGQQSWKNIQSISELFDAYPALVQEVFEPFDLDYPGLESVKMAYEKGDWVIAAEALLRYYRVSENARELARDIPTPSAVMDAEADTLLNYVFTIQNVRGAVPLGADGHRDWYYKGPNNDREWAWLSNRHTQLARVMNVYFETGNVKYARFVDEFLKDFILKSMPYPAEKGNESIWRGLEVAARAKVWTRVFYGMSNSTHLSDATRLLILRSLPDHAHYNRSFHGGNNWLTMEISALSTIAAYFPELQDSGAWLDYSIDAMVASMRDQVYPDGVQTELASHYHNVSLHNFELFKEICEKAGRSLPAYFENTIRDMYRYIAHAVRPDGHRILNNDGDRGSDRELILAGARKYQAADWEYIATNGLRGSIPAGGPSFFFPWAGQLISRNGYGPHAHWSFFDVGPWGSGHQHNDKLHLSIAAYGRDLLVDAGRFAYTGAVAEKFRPYALSSAGHNLLLLDGKGQGRGPTHAQNPLTEEDVVITEDFDFAYGMFDSFLDLEGEASHARSMMYVRDHFWVVVDRVFTDRPRTVEALWHWHPDCDPLIDGNRIQTNNSFGNLTIVPVGPSGWRIDQVRGQEDPVIQGWYSPEYNVYGPNTTSIYQMPISENSQFVWVLVPSEKPGVAASAAISESTEEAIKLEVEVAGDRWVLTIPQKGTDGVGILRR
ncbi:MAG: alginate lyase family protein [Lunatimonas sp.]|uniref:alginate lyase family protein n=1 Tax=Lunatimonas sp. TaxID=2060141 RepID=UPI00263B0351|nr:alginate lyase family protein [Lunatimonas sp.]MCC5937075.1 alginate lyase family protein [Lunatimonas sp.]